jgi:hypothetical protein
MKRQIQGLHEADHTAAGQICDGLLLVCIQKAQHRWESRKRFYLLRFLVLEPKELAGHSFTGRLYYAPRGLWKLNWFLRDFGYDSELLGRDEIDEKNLAGLRGVVKISHAVVKGTSLPNLDSFAPASDWNKLRVAPKNASGQGVAR